MKLPTAKQISKAIVFSLRATVIIPAVIFMVAFGLLPVLYSILLSISEQDSEEPIDLIVMILLEIVWIGIIAICTMVIL